MKKSFLVEAKRNDKIVFENRKAKTDFFILSLWILFLLIIILTLDVEFLFNDNFESIHIITAFKRNIIPLVSLIFLIYGLIIYGKYSYKMKGTMELPVKICELQSIDYEPLAFLITYIIPFIYLDMTNYRSALVFIILIVVIWRIYIKTDLYYANPTLSLLGYHIYRVKTDSDEYPEGVFISYGKLSKSQKVEFLALDEKVYICRRKNNES